MLLKQKPNPTKTDAAQLERWNLSLSGWNRVANGGMCVVIGDTNLDFFRWQNPEQSHVKIVQRTKEEIETAGFSQIIKGVSRSWRGQSDSLVDQCWVHQPQRVISHQNEARGCSDHNVTSVILRTKDRLAAPKERRKRRWKIYPWTVSVRK